MSLPRTLIRTIWRVPLVITLTAFSGWNQSAAGQERAPEPGHAWVIFGTDTVFAETAITAEERRQGLMGRESLKPGTGMLFVYNEEDYRSFWMSNTLIALDIAFLDSEQRVADIQQMEPETTESHLSKEPAMFALEVPQGWFASKGIEMGAQARVVLPPPQTPL